MASSLEGYVSKRWFKTRFEFSIFTDIGMVNGSKYYVGDNEFDHEVLVDIGFGFRISKKILGKNWHFRIDFPCWKKDKINTTTSFEIFIFSFQRSI